MQNDLTEATAIATPSDTQFWPALWIGTGSQRFGSAAFTLIVNLRDASDNWMRKGITCGALATAA
jgi:hypothetical protein